MMAMYFYPEDVVISEIEGQRVARLACDLRLLESGEYELTNDQPGCPEKLVGPDHIALLKTWQILRATYRTEQAAKWVDAHYPQVRQERESWAMFCANNPPSISAWREWQMAGRR